MTLRIALDARDRSIFHLALPALGSLAADPLLSMVDTALVGHLGVAPLAALAISVVVFNLAFMVFNFLAYATTGPVARRLSSGRAEEIPAFAVQALWLALLLGITATAAAEAAAEPLGRLVGAKGEVLTLFLAYFRIRILALTPLLITLAGHGLFRGLQDTRTPLITVGVNAVNGLGTTSYLPVGPGVRAPPSPRFASRWGPSFCGEPRGASAVGPRFMAAPARAHARPAPLSPDLASAPSRGTAPTSPLPTAATRMGTWRWPPTRWRWTCGCSWPCDGLAGIAGRRDRPAPGLANRRRPGPLFPHPVRSVAADGAGVG